jgi:hypothetical protein
MGVYPTECHDAVSNLCLKKFDFSIICHCALVLLACLWWHNQRVNQQLSVAFNTRKDGTCFNFIVCVGLGNSQKVGHDVNRANHRLHACIVLE